MTEFEIPQKDAVALAVQNEDVKLTWRNLSTEEGQIRLLKAHAELADKDAEYEAYFDKGGATSEVLQPQG